MTAMERARVPGFVLAGHAVFTLRSKTTDRRFTYKMVQNKDKPELYFIHLLVGPDNTKDYSYIGCYYRDSKYFHPCQTYRDVPRRNRPLSMQALQYFFDNLYTIPDDLVVYHEGKCARCGRKLTTPESIELGFGPECIKFS